MKPKKQMYPKSLPAIYFVIYISTTRQKIILQKMPSQDNELKFLALNTVAGQPQKQAKRNVRNEPI